MLKCADRKPYDQLTSRLAVNAERLSLSRVPVPVAAKSLSELDPAWSHAWVATLAGQIARVRARKLEGRGIHALIGAILLAFMAGGFGQEMLWLLWRESQYGRFVEVYLNALYQHPTAGLVGRFAGKALHSSQLVGREKDMMKAFQQVTSIPLDFEPKRQVMAAVEATSLVAQSSPSKNKASL